MGRDDGLDLGKVELLLRSMWAHSTPPKPEQLGIIGRDHLAAKFEAEGCELGSFDYKRVTGVDDDGLPWVIEAAFGWCPDASQRRLVTGVNWSPGIVNPFRVLGRFGMSLDTILSQQRVDQSEPVILFLHAARPGVEYLDRGKSTVVTT